MGESGASQICRCIDLRAPIFVASSPHPSPCDFAISPRGMGVGFKHKTCCGPWKVGRATRWRCHSVLRRRVCLPWRQCTSATVLRRKCRGQLRGLGRRRRDTGSRSGRTPASAAPSPPADAPARVSPRCLKPRVLKLSLWSLI